jgi:hypothetical protein
MRRATALMLALLAAAPASAAADAVCGALAHADPAMRDQRVRACFHERVLPALRRAETNPAVLESAADTFHEWLRAFQLVGYPENAFSQEYGTGKASLITALKYAYGKAQERCLQKPGPMTAEALVTPVQTSMMFGWSEDDMLFPTFDEDFRKCTTRATYRISVRTTQSDEKHGLMSDFQYVALLAPNASGEAGEFEGWGVYSGFLVSSSQETPNGRGGCTAQGKPMRFTVRGKLEASASFLDMTALGGKNGITYVLTSTDWPLKPLFVDPKDAYAQTEEEKDSVKGMATVARIDPIALTGPVTTLTDSSSQPGGVCAGNITSTEKIQITRIGR